MTWIHENFQSGDIKHFGPYVLKFQTNSHKRWKSGHNCSEIAGFTLSLSIGKAGNKGWDIPRIVWQFAFALNCVNYDSNYFAINTELWEYQSFFFSLSQILGYTWCFCWIFV